MILAVLGLPFVVWLDLRKLSDRVLHSQAAALTQVMGVMRSYYAANVVERVLGAPETAHLPRHDYLSQPGTIPIPATMALEIGTLIGAASGDVSYRFVSDLPFEGRVSHGLNGFETEALETFRAAPSAQGPALHSSGSLAARETAMITPIVMNRGCVQCHNSHPESPKTDWQIGDVRGIQVVTVRQQILPSVGSFSALLTYFGVVAAAVAAFSAQQMRLSGAIGRLNAELAEKNAFLSNVSEKIARYIPPQVFRRVFTGEEAAAISTQRKKLTVFMSDIVDFTQTTDRMQPEEITLLLNEYFTEMSQIADAHGATIDKFVGDAIVGFFGDPETRGVTEDARACLAMATAMQARMLTLHEDWVRRGIEHPFRIRIGINTGYCDVGNFGSETRMDYTMIGVEANLTARLEGLAQPGGIVLSYATYALVRDEIEAEALEPLAVKGISWPVVPYEVLLPWHPRPARQVETESEGFHLALDPDVMDPIARADARETLRQALRRLGPDGT